MHNTPKVDELEVHWDDSICKLIHKKCHKKIYHSDIKYHMTLNTTVSVATILFLFSFPIRFDWRPLMIKPTT